MITLTKEELKDLYKRTFNDDEDCITKLIDKKYSNIKRNRCGKLNGKIVIDSPIDFLTMNEVYYECGYVLYHTVISFKDERFKGPTKILEYYIDDRRHYLKYVDDSDIIKEYKDGKKIKHKILRENRKIYINNKFINHPNVFYFIIDYNEELLKILNK